MPAKSKTHEDDPPDDDRDPYAEGADAALAGQSDTSNPYPVGTTDHLSWNDGYMSIDEDETGDD